MNGRVYAVNRSPVLAWNVEVPYPEMPAAAAAISPIVPAASDPYGRCWQNQVDPGSSFPYFGALYNNSLPPTAYRLQPGCMPNLGQFWPPTPPPDGCGRFDGSNLYFGPPVLRHGENNISSNIRSSFHNLGHHYPHLVETSKESAQRVFKQETAVSPTVSSSSAPMCSSVLKSDNLSACSFVESKLKSPCSVSRSMPKQELHSVSSSHEPYYFATDIRSSSSLHPSTDKSCLSSTYSLKGNLSIHSPPQENALKSKSICRTQENNCNASPLKNVYFSHYESENVNSTQCRNFEKSADEQFFPDHKQSSLNSNKSRHLYQPLSDYQLSNISKKYDFHGVHDFHKAAVSHRSSDALFKEHYKQKSHTSKIKPEKTPSYDCKYQKSSSQSSAIAQIQDSKNSDVLNIPTSVMCPKVEPKDKYFLPSNSSSVSSCMASSFTTSSNPFLMSSSSSRTTASNYQNSIYQNSCSLNNSWSCNDLPVISPNNYFKSPEAAKLPFHNQTCVTSALHESLISVAQTAPPDIQIAKEALNGLSQVHSSPVHKKIVFEADDDVQIIGVQNKTTSVKQGKYNTEPNMQYRQSPASTRSLCIKIENDKENLQEHTTSKSDDLNSIPPSYQGSDCLFNYSLKQTHGVSKIKLEPQNDTIPQDEVARSATPSDVAVVSVKIENDENITSKEHLIEESECEKILNTSLASEKTEISLTNAILRGTSSDLKVDEDVSPSNSSKCKSDLEKQSLPVLSELHGLNLLLDTIEKVTSFEAVASKPVELKSPEILNEECDVKRTSSPSCNVLKSRGLDLLSSIAVERLVSEFDVIKIEPKEDSSIISNYPQIKEEPKLTVEDELLKQNGDTVARIPSSVFEMRDKLVELQKKYKQKQKELSRLKPKKRFTNIYLKCCHKLAEDSSDQNSLSNNSNSISKDNSSVCSSLLCSDQDVKSESIADDSSNTTMKVENKEVNGRKWPKRNQRSFKKESSVEILSDEEVQEIYVHKRITRRSSGRNSFKFLTSNFKRKKCSVALHTENVKYGQQRKYSRFRRKKIETICSESDKSCLHSSPNNSTKANSLPENLKKSKAYSLRHSSQFSTKFVGSSDILIPNSKALSSKRKSVNPKRYVPSKQGKLSETIIAKHLRSRILFDMSGSLSDEENGKDSVPDDLYDALMKCHLVDEKSKIKTLCEDGSELPSKNVLGYPEPSKLSPDNLVEKQRLLALEDGLFYAGFIKECQSSNRYGIALDGQRGNKLHMFTREELLTQTITESKPVTSELPEGTRVCAYWSQQYRCLYPGVIGKAPCPSADWSEPRVFVLFDDGDSGQIPTKNVRLIPSNIIPSVPECMLDSSCSSNNISNLKRKQGSIDQVPRRLRSSTPKKKHKSVLNESKESSCTSINDSSCDDSCFMDFPLSPSQILETVNSAENNCLGNSSVDYSKSEKRQRKHSKRKVTSRTKTRDSDCPDAKGKGEVKTKRHKKYKDKHRRHHHHHHRHHHHHHHHHHSKKRKHRRKTGKSPTSQDLEYENCIPCKSNLKSHKTFEVVSTDLTEHSSTIHLPQIEQDKI